MTWTAHTTLTVHIDITAMPDGYDEAIRRAITTATHGVLRDIDVTMLVLTNVTVGAAPRVAAVAGHRCAPAGSTGTTHPNDTDKQGDDR